MSKKYEKTAKMNLQSHKQVYLSNKIEIDDSSSSSNSAAVLIKKEANLSNGSKSEETNSFELPSAGEFLQPELDSNELAKKYYQRGFTPLHRACLESNFTIAELLITRYQADPEAVFAEGFQPIHFAILENSISLIETNSTLIIELLLGTSVSTETRITKTMFEKYHKSKSPRHQPKWRKDYGDSITLLTFAVLYDKFNLIEVLMRKGANSGITDSNGKTLLMTAVDFRFKNVVKNLIATFRYEEINRVDCDGFTALHYLFKQETKKSSRLVEPEEIFDDSKDQILKLLVKGGADICTLIRGDSATLLINIVAYLHEYEMLKFLLPRQRYLSIAKPLFYALLPNYVNYPSKYLGLSKQNNFKKSSPDIFEIIVKDIKLRLAFGWPVNLEEVQRINDAKLIYRHHDRIPNIVAHSKNYCNIEYSGMYSGKINIFHYLSKSLEQLQKLARDEEIFIALKKFEDTFDYETQMMATILKERLRQALRKDLLTNEFKKLAFFNGTMFFYIPFDCTREIADYLSLGDLQSFICAYQTEDQNIKQGQSRKTIKRNQSVTTEIFKTQNFNFQNKKINPLIENFRQLDPSAPSWGAFATNTGLKSGKNTQQFYNLWN